MPSIALPKIKYQSPDSSIPLKQRISLGNNWIIQINPSEKNQTVYIELREKRGGGEITRKKFSLLMGNSDEFEDTISKIYKIH